jgi:predicted lipase
MLNFGCPRVGDDAYAAFSDSKIPNQWRMVHLKDIVPHNPGSAWPFNFYHTSTEVYEDKQGNYKVCSKGEDKTCSN